MLAVGDAIGVEFDAYAPCEPTPDPGGVPGPLYTQGAVEFVHVVGIPDWKSSDQKGADCLKLSETWLAYPVFSFS